MPENEINYEQSIWSIKINNQLLYKKYVDGVTTLWKTTQEQNEQIKDVLDKAISDATSALAGRESKREALAKRELDEIDATPMKNSTWVFKINAQLLYKKTVGGRTILFGMTEKEHENTAKIMDAAIVELLEILKDKTDFREAKEKPVQTKNMDPIAMAMNSIQNSTGIEEELEQAKKDLEEAKKEPLTEKIKEATKNTLRKKVQKKKDNDSDSSFWDQLK